MHISWVLQMLKVKVIVTQSCLTLCDPTDCSLPGFSVYGILQARILEGVVISFSRRTSWLMGRTQVSCISGRFLTTWATRKVNHMSRKLNLNLFFTSRFYTVIFDTIPLVLFLWPSSLQLLPHLFQRSDLQSLFSEQKRYSFSVIASNLVYVCIPSYTQKQSTTTMPSLLLYCQMQLQHGLLVFQNNTCCCWLWPPLRGAAKPIQQKCLGHRPRAR